MIPFNLPPKTGLELNYIEQAIQSDKLCGDGQFSKKCESWIEENFNINKALLTPSCTAALELAAILIDIQPGDEVIMPSYTFVSTANAFVLRGAKIKFIDVRPDTMNLNELLIEAAITPKTRAIVPVHYAGVACEMDTILAIAEKYSLWVIEDAAQGVMSKYKGRALGSIGHIGCFSFHETKNYSSGGEGGAILVNDPKLHVRAEIIREKGTNRSQFLLGMVDKYSWVDIGSSFLPSELQAAYLYGQLEMAEKINSYRLDAWDFYLEELMSLAGSGKIQIPEIPDDCCHNAHMFYIKVKSLHERTSLITHLELKGITAAFHYVPLHSAKAGLQYADFFGVDIYTTKDSERLIRLPLWYGISKLDQLAVCQAILDYYKDSVSDKASI